jgi:hypothetical protein
MKKLLKLVYEAAAVIGPEGALKADTMITINVVEIPVDLPGESQPAGKCVGLSRYERLLKDDPEECFPQYTGKRVRYALAMVDLVNRKPTEILRME